MTESDEGASTPDLAYWLLGRVEEFDQGNLTEGEFRRAIASDLEVADRRIDTRSTAEIWSFIEADVDRFVRHEIVFNDLFDRLDDASQVLSGRGSWPDPEFDALMRILERAVSTPSYRSELISALQRWLLGAHYQVQKLSS